MRAFYLTQKIYPWGIDTQIPARYICLNASPNDAIEATMQTYRVTEENYGAAIEAAEQRGAEIAVAELIAAARRAVSSTAGYADPAMFIAHFCGGIQGTFRDLAVELARGAGMPHLYPDDAAQFHAQRIPAEVEHFARKVA